MIRLLALLLLLPLFAVAPAQPDFCDPDLRSHRRDNLGYRGRERRCEGRYIAPRSGTTTLNVISYTLRPADFDPTSRGRVEVAWCRHIVEPVSLRVSSLRSGVYYRLDTRLTASDTSFSWPTQPVLQGLRLQGAELAFLASTQPRSGTPDRVLLPVEVLPSPRGAPRNLHLVVVPGRRLQELYVTFLTPDGQRVELPRAAVGQRPYAPGRRIAVPIPARLGRGVHRVDLEAETGPGMPSVVRKYVFVP